MRILCLVILLIFLFNCSIIFEIYCKTTISQIFNDSIEIKWNSTTEKLIWIKIIIAPNQNLNNEIKEKAHGITRTLTNSTSPVKVGNLLSGVNYQVEINEIQNNTSKSYFTYITTKPNEPDKVACFHDKNNINARWSRPYSVFENYHILVKGERFDGFVDIFPEQIRHWGRQSIIFSKMNKHKSYNITIKTKTKNGIFSKSVEVKCHTLSEPPTDVRVAPKTLNSDSFAVQWSPPKNGTQFQSFKICIENPFKCKVYPKTGPFIHYFNEDIKPGHTYKVGLATLSYNQTSERKVLFVTTPPLHVLNLRKRVDYNSHIHLHWDVHNHSIQDSYRIDYWTDDRVQNISITSIQPHILLKDLLAGNKYKLEVYAISKSRESVATSISLSILPLGPNFINDKCIEDSTNSLRVSWTFDIKRSKRDYFMLSWQIFPHNITNEEKIYDLNFADIHDYHPGAIYSINIKAVSDRMESEADTLNCMVRPLPPNDLKIESQTNNSTNISWSEPNSLFEFYVLKVYFKRKLPKKEYKLTKNITWFNIDNLSQNEKYNISLFSFSNGVISNGVYLSNFKADENLMKYLGEVEQGNFENFEANPKNSIWLYIVISLATILIITMAMFLAIFKYGKTLFRRKKAKSINQGKEILSKQDDLLSTIDENIRIDKNDLVVETLINQGNFGEVYSGSLKSRSGRIETRIAIKKSKLLDESNMGAFLQEAIIMKNFDHDHILKLIGVSIDTNGSPLVVLPFMERGDLLSYLRNPLNQPKVAQLIQFGIDAAKGMEYLSKQRFVHRDLAARNCMLDNNLRVKVSDFGLARDIYTSNYYKSFNQQLLPLRWMSIESLETGKYDTKTDVWSYGVLMWEILTRGLIPYSCLQNSQVLVHLKAGNRLTKPDHCPETIYQILLLCWSFDPKMRPSFTQLVKRLEEILANPNLLKRNHLYYNNSVLYSERELID